MIMDSPSFQSATIIHPTRVRSHTSYSTVHSRGAVQKRAHDNDRSRAISLSRAEKLLQYAAEQAGHADIEHPHPTSTTSTIVGGIQWLTPQHSPQPQSFTAESSLEPFPQWTAPTPPRSESSFPTVSIDCNEEPGPAGLSIPPDFAFEQPSVTAEMR